MHSKSRVDVAENPIVITQLLAAVAFALRSSRATSQPLGGPARATPLTRFQQRDSKFLGGRVGVAKQIRPRPLPPLAVYTAAAKHPTPTPLPPSSAHCHVTRSLCHVTAIPPTAGRVGGCEWLANKAVCAVQGRLMPGSGDEAGGDERSVAGDVRREARAGGPPGAMPRWHAKRAGGYVGAAQRQGHGSGPRVPFIGNGMLYATTLPCSCG